MSDDHLPDHYEDLKISPNADPEAIDRVFRMLAKRYHPDNGCSGCVDKFDAVTKAYSALSDPVKRASFDARYKPIRNRRWKLAAAAAERQRQQGPGDSECGALGPLY